MKRLLLISLLVLFGCTKDDMPSSNDSASQEIEKVELTTYASEGGYVRPLNGIYKGRLQFTIVRLPGSEITIEALPADGYYFFGWSNGWTANPLTFKLNSDMEITAVFKQINK
jgi:hypothetical protein